MSILTRTLPRPQDFPHSIVETLRFADTDRNGHITSSVFAICCQIGRLALLSDPARGLEPPSSQFVLASIQLDYLNELQWPGTVEVGTRVDRIGRSSVTLAQALFQSGRCAAIARSVAVLMDAKTRGSRPIPKTSVDALQAFTTGISGELDAQAQARASAPPPTARDRQVAPLR
jgi:acyl-CoA thioester hydrolase